MFLMEVDGIKYDGFVSASVSRSLENFSSIFNFSATHQPGKSFPIKIGSTCKIVINDTVIMDGFIESINISYDSSQHLIQISGRDKTADLVDSQIGGVDIEFTQPNVSFKDLVEKVLSILNISNIKLIQKDKIKDFGEGEIESASSGQTAFDFLETYARKRQIVLTTDGSGNIVARKSPIGTYATILSSRVDSQSTILLASFKFDISQRFNKYEVISSDNLSSFTDMDEVPAQQSANTKSITVIDDQIRKTRLYAFVPDQSCDQTQSNDQAKWEAAYRRSKSLVYNVTVQGFIALDDNKIWEPNYLVTVLDDYAVLTGQLLIAGVIYDYSIDTGSKTTLTCYASDSFTLEAADPSKSKSKESSSAETAAVNAWLKKHPFKG